MEDKRMLASAATSTCLSCGTLGALPAIMDAKRKKVPAETPRDWAAELAQAPDLGRDSLRAVAVKVLGVVQVWLARKGFSCPGPSSPEAWATLFQSVDFAGHGKLSYSSFQAAVLDRMKGRGRVSETELLALWRVVDVSRKMELREEQFSNVLYRLQTETWPRLSPADFERHIEVLNAAAHKWHRASGNWYKILTLCDEEKSGKLSFEEFNKVVRRTFPGLSISPEEISEDQLRGIWRSMDADQSGWVSVQEFMVWMRSNARNRNLHRQMNNTEAKRRLLEEQQRQEGHVPTKTMEELVSAKQQLEARVLAYLSRKGLRLKIKDSWEHVWKEADVEKYGRLSFPQLEEYLRSVVNRLDRNSDLRALFAEADADRSGEVSAAEWYTMLYRLEVSSWPTSETVNVPRAVMTINSAAAKWYQAGSNWFKVFRLADDTSGRIDFSDFQNMIRHRAPGLGLNKKKISDTELKCLWRAMDADMSGDVRIEEFMVFMRRSQCERAQKEARQRLKPQSGMEDALELMVQGLSRCSVEELANAYQDWGLPWTGMVSEWEWQLIARKLLCYGEARIDDSSLHAVWTTVDTKLRGQVGASDLLATMRGLRAAKQRRAEAPADKIEPIRNPNADPYTSLVPDFSARSLGRAHILAKCVVDDTPSEWREALPGDSAVRAASQGAWLRRSACQGGAQDTKTVSELASTKRYATAYERFRSLEEQLRNVREGLSARRKENLELSRKNLELDRTAKSLQEKIAEATTELERCSRSQGELDAAVAEGLQACDAEKAAAEIQSQRLARDLNRFTCMKAKLQELLVASDRPQEVLRLLAEAEALATRTALALAESREVAEKGIVPMEESSAPFPEAAS
eukprot:s76_g4.t1